MADAPKQARPTPLGIYDKPEPAGVSGVEITAIALSLIWVMGSGLYFLTGRADSTASADTTLVGLMAVFLPVAMIWVAATAARASRVMREESMRLQAAIDAIRQAYIAQSQGRDMGQDSSVVKKLNEIAEATRKTETTLAMFQSARQDPGAAPPEAQQDTQTAEPQPALALGTRAEELAPPMDAYHLIRALNFPETEEDEEGFAALRKAMRDRNVAQLVTAAQDILTLLSQDGIYMDDLRPDRARPEIWREFAEGARGRAIAPLGGIRDRSSLALSAGRMKQDPIFRDAAHHFLRRFDTLFSLYAETLSDEEITQFADTRTARAFMLLGRVAGTFD